ncbi:MAG: hypothetical protein PGN34_07630 [Methylobacterium frigidaeris]
MRTGAVTSSKSVSDCGFSAPSATGAGRVGAGLLPRVADRVALGRAGRHEVADGDGIPRQERRIADAPIHGDKGAARGGHGRDVLVLDLRVGDHGLIAPALPVARPLDGLVLGALDEPLAPGFDHGRGTAPTTARHFLFDVRDAVVIGSHPRIGVVDLGTRAAQTFGGGLQFFLGQHGNLASCPRIIAGDG